MFFLLPAAAQVPVSFNSTVEAFEAGQHEQARMAFKRMSQAGLTEAQFNYGVMLISEQGGPRELTEGSAWIMLAANSDYRPASRALEVLREQLSEERWQEIEQASITLESTYGREALLERHRPRFSDEGEASFRTGGEHETKLGDLKLTLTTPPPRYPAEAAQAEAFGIVFLGAWVEPDGEVTQPHVLDSFPEGIFDRAAMRAFSRTEAEWLDEPPAEAQYLTQQISFSMGSDRSSSQGLAGGPALRELRRTLEDRDTDLAAQHRVVWMIDEMALPLLEPLDPELVLEVAHRAALAGVGDAQMDLARRLRTGRQVEQDLESARFWLEQAAFEGHAMGSFELSRFPDIDPAFQRELRQAAIEQDLLAAVLWEIRYLVRHPEETSSAEMSALLERLPRQLRRDRNDPIISAARNIAAR